MRVESNQQAKAINERSFYFLFWKFIYHCVDHFLPRSDFPVFGKLFLKNRVHVARHISPFISKKAIIQKGALIRPEVWVEDYGEIGKNCRTDRGVHIGANVLMAPNVHFYTTYHHFDAERGCYSNFPGDPKPIFVGEGSWIGYGVIVLGGVSLGKRVVVGAGAVVTKSSPDDCLVAGNPAVVKKRYGTNDRP
jgi:acetyltransferase-like isoleucine patch superfamily enzyme